ncbi:MAG TPA: AAA family ATPase [Archangium sp.]|uniref:KGGVGR-motif variant AAA ATPase n=1 Tax=Archangium sp. TaxID=1872627 RepID=UPI002E322CFA|nr:AAA family ATPase [Archangium sp.]HEX5753674.1 AAA family ATPase [Archangium sp.]
MVTFDDVLPTLVRVIEESSVAATIRRAGVVRDLEGRVRLIIEPDPSQPIPDMSALEQALVQALQRWIEPPLLMTTDLREPGRLARALMGKSNIQWPDARYVQSSTLQEVPATPGRWNKIERRLSKYDWVRDERATPPWPLREGSPPIVTFYSFKGGVGRTTLLASCAWQLAELGKKVVVVDLDVEAPGLSALFEVESRRGVVDFLVDFIGTGQIDMDGLVSAPGSLGPLKGNIEVVTAGNLDERYFEKLSRLDFIGGGLLDVKGESPVERGLRHLLGALRGRQADYIFIDSRAGLHDIAGLSLHGLAHVDVFVSRASEQGYRGLELTLQALGRRKKVDDLLCVVAHSLAPPDPASQEAKIEEEEFLKRAYRAFDQSLYGKLPESPQLEDDEEPHWPKVIRRHPLLERLTHLGAAREVLFSEGYKQLLERIVELCEPEEDVESTSEEGIQ